MRIIYLTDLVHTTFVRVAKSDQTNFSVVFFILYSFLHDFRFRYPTDFVRTTFVRVRHSEKLIFMLMFHFVRIAA